MNRSQIGGAVIAALLATLAFPPFDFWPCLALALVPLLWAIGGSDPRRGWKCGYLFGLIFSIGELHWLYQLVLKWTGSFWLAVIPWIIACALMSVYFGWAGWLTQRSLAVGRIWAIPLIWAGIEAFRSYIPVLAFPWSLIAGPLAQTPALIQTAHFGTIYFVSAWLVAVNLFIYLSAEVARKRRVFDRQAWGVLAFATVIPLISVVLYRTPRPTHITKISIGQTGIDMAYEADPGVTEAKISEVISVFDREAELGKSQLLVLPEGVARGSQELGYFKFPLKSKPATLFGAERLGAHKKIYQSAVGFDGHWASADKTRLVIFGEFVPARDFLPLPAEFHLPSGDLSAGEEGVKALTLGGLTVGPLLCFEGLFPDLAYRQSQNGASLLAVMSIDDWFMNSSAPEQLRGASIWRAVETGLPVVRAASLGSSLACDSQGKVIAEAPLGTSTLISVDLPVPNSAPFDKELPVFPIVSFLTVIWLSMPSRKVSDIKTAVTDRAGKR